MTARHVVVIGGGLAGITAAIALREAGIGVTLLEARPWLGGATCSFSRGELAIDNGQHIFLRCCTAYRELLARLGMTGSATLQERFDVTVLSGARPARPARPAGPGCGGPRCPARCTWAGRWLATPFSPPASGSGWAGPRWPCDSPIRPRPGWTASGSVTGSPRGGRASMPGGCSGTCSSSRR